MKHALFLVIALTCSDTSRALQAADVDRQIRLPVLTVLGDPPVGELAHLRFHCVRRDGDRTPLSIAVVEDTPGGAGESIRASLWLAAMVAALERNDDLSGVRLSLELSGQVDGPSAGAVLCLAVLSALDGRDFPADCAVTGAIMPDGTIGGVGALAEKLRAAAKRGVRRVLVPAYVRFEPDAAIGEDVDLKRLAESLGIELIPAENVARAYLHLHRQTPVTAVQSDRHVLDLPAATEEVYKRQYQEHRRVGLELWKAIPQAERDAIVAEPALKAVFVDAPADAERAFRSGRLIYAAGSTSVWRSALEARKRNEASLATVHRDAFTRRDVAGVLGQLDPILRRTTASLPRLSDALTKNGAEWAESNAQFFADYHDLYGLLGLSAVLQQSVDALAGELADANLDPNDRETYYDALLNYKFIQMFLAQCVAGALEAWPVETDAVVRTLPGRPVTEDVAAVERLFYSAHLAVNNSFRQDVVRSAAAMLQATDAELLDGLAANDVGLAMHRAPADLAQQLHGELAGIADLRRRRFATAASAHLQAECLAVMSGLVIRWQELDVEIDDDGNFRYGRTDLLNYLITTARENALTAIAACRESEIPCIGPIGRFESGELSRDDVDVDKVDVLVAYWSATLQVKALLMLCSDTVNEPPPATRTGRATGPTPAAPVSAAPSPPGARPSATRRLIFPPAAGDPGHRESPRVVGVPFRHSAPVKPAVPKPAPNAGGGAKGVGAVIVALGLGLLAFFRKLFGGVKPETSPPAATDGDAKT